MVRLRKQKVVSAREMTRIEKKSFGDGQSAEQYMRKAGHGIAKRIIHSITEHAHKQQVSLLVGKGNNGGDAFAAGTELLEHGYEVNAFHLFATEEHTTLNQLMEQEFIGAGGEVYSPHALDDIALFSKGVIVDGVLGTGFSGSTSGFLAEVIEYVNSLDIPVLSLDIPSGVNGNTGEVEGEAIIADETIYLGLPKIGLFTGDGYAYSGTLYGIDFGLPARYSDDATPLFYTLSESALRQCMPVPHPQQHKYGAGYVVAVSGSLGMSGAAYLSTLASLRVGAGIVRLFYHPNMQPELGGKPWEILAEPFSGQRIEHELRRAGALVIGPGFAHAEEACALVERAAVPTVIDASGISALAPRLTACRQDIICTPHRGELAALVNTEGLSDVERIERCQEYVEETGIYLLVKGAPTFFFEKGNEPLVLPYGNPGMATAGTGDVLAGIIGSFLAQGLLPKEAVPLAVYVHGLAGDLAAAEMGEHALIASDLLTAVPDVMRELSKTETTE